MSKLDLKLESKSEMGLELMSKLELKSHSLPALIWTPNEDGIECLKLKGDAGLGALRWGTNIAIIHPDAGQLGGTGG